jgi:hypothetical protein
MGSENEVGYCNTGVRVKLTISAVTTAKVDITTIDAWRKPSQSIFDA